MVYKSRDKASVCKEISEYSPQQVSCTQAREHQGEQYTCPSLLSTWSRKELVFLHILPSSELALVVSFLCPLNPVGSLTLPCPSSLHFCNQSLCFLSRVLVQASSVSHLDNHSIFWFPISSLFSFRAVSCAACRWICPEHSSGSPAQTPCWVHAAPLLWLRRWIFLSGSLVWILAPQLADSVRWHKSHPFCKLHFLLLEDELIIHLTQRSVRETRCLAHSNCQKLLFSRRYPWFFLISSCRFCPNPCGTTLLSLVSVSLPCSLFLTATWMLPPLLLSPCLSFHLAPSLSVVRSVIHKIYYGGFHIYRWSLNSSGLWSTDLHAVENLNLTLQPALRTQDSSVFSGLHLWSQPTMDCGVHLLKKIV